MTPNELIDAVRTCLPLPGIERVRLGHDFGGRKSGVLLNEQCDTFDFAGLDAEYASRLIIGAIVQACAERGWIAQSFSAQDTIIIWTGEKYEQRHEAKGTDAIVWCRAYAAALKSTKGPTE